MSAPLNIYESMGAEFLLPQYKISEKLNAVKAFVFDWDGVFNNGEKGANSSSGFNEIDSMGVNLLRFCFFLKNQTLPTTAILSGEKNDTAFLYSKREHFNQSYFKVPNKIMAFDHFCEQSGLKPLEVCYFFDDVLDLPVARTAGLRICIPRKASTQFNLYVKQNHLADYFTANTNSSYAVREACEMLMTAYGLFDRAVTLRTDYDDLYKQYITERNHTPTAFYSSVNDAISKVDL